MKINSTGADFIRSDQARELQRSSEEKSVRKVASQPASSSVQRSDKVEISAEARQLARGSEVAQASGSLTPDRVAQIREKILSGAYNSLDVVDQVARKMLASGDI